jgi:hypothetical protein
MQLILGVLAFVFGRHAGVNGYSHRYTSKYPSSPIETEIA